MELLCYRKTHGFNIVESELIGEKSKAFFIKATINQK
jgi:hypothetical protein